MPMLKFCKLFYLPTQCNSIEALIKFSDLSKSDSIKYNYNIPSGYTFLGQFIAHDMSFNIEKSIINI